MTLTRLFATLKLWLRNLAFTIIAALVVALVTTPITSIANLLWLNSIDMPVTFATAMQVILADWVGLTPALTIVFSFGLGLAFLAAHLSFPYIQNQIKRQDWWYELAGALGILATIIGISELLFQTQLIGGTRSYFGLILHLAGGALGGWVFYRLSLRRAQSQTA
ncbi:MAG: hypothetical protein ACR2PW_01440 [Gammaproteobacteria bacterium]